jgi:hypothetical protein
MRPENRFSPAAMWRRCCSPSALSTSHHHSGPALIQPQLAHQAPSKHRSFATATRRNHRLGPASHGHRRLRLRGANLGEHRPILHPKLK